jgi:molecular chaperone HscB
MTYFEIFGSPVRLKIAPAELSARFFALSREFHPDFHAQADEATREKMLEKSAMLNKAWKTFQSPEETIKYVLQLKGLLEEEEKYQLAPDFLMEVMEINEALMDPEEADTVALGKRIDSLQNEIYAPVQEVVENYQEGITTEKELLQVKAYYYQKKYLDRIKQQLAGMA